MCRLALFGGGGEGRGGGGGKGRGEGGQQVSGKKGEWSTDMKDREGGGVDSLLITSSHISTHWRLNPSGQFRTSRNR